MPDGSWPICLGHLRVAVAVVAQREQRDSAEEAVPAGEREGHDHAVALLQPGDGGTDLLDDAHGLVADDVAGLHCRGGAGAGCAGRSRRCPTR